MTFRFLAAALIAGFGLTPAAATAAEKPNTTSTYVGRVDPTAFHKVPLENAKMGTTVDPATVRQITPGIDKFTIYRLIGTPHFGEGITRRWNYVLFFPTALGSTERMRCRMEIRFKHQRGHYNVVVSEVIWQDQACADRVATAS
jgi:outer membrane protein assembly factor BamE (lipoprotein component of BamABCDE complex)